MPGTPFSSLFSVASQMGFPFPDPEQGRAAAKNGDVWLGRFTRRRNQAGPGIFLGRARSDGAEWHVEFESGLDERARARCLDVLRKIV